MEGEDERGRGVQQGSVRAGGGERREGHQRAA